MLELADRLFRCNPERNEPIDDPVHNNLVQVRKHEIVAREILAIFMQFRRVSGPQTSCTISPCQSCLGPHFSKIVSAVALSRPVSFVLPAFPGKSPNLAKVLGTLPDMAERLALEFLQQLCDRVKKIYSPGAHIVLCSDGRVFSDVVGMCDEDVTAYQREISRIITESGFTDLSVFALDQVYGGLSYDQMRKRLMEEYGGPLDVLKASVSRGGKSLDCTDDDKEARQLYCGITRFLVEDSTFPGQIKSRTAIQNDCRMRAYEVIQRSKAWGEWVEALFPQSIRLSIHPQSCGSKKLGLRLIGTDQWLTPWHGVAVKVRGGFVLLKRFQAEQLRADLIYLDGRPSHYILNDEKELMALQRAEYGT